MDAFVDLVAIVSMPGVFFVVVGQGVIGAGLPLLLLVGVLDPSGRPGGSAVTDRGGAAPERPAASRGVPPAA